MNLKIFLPLLLASTLATNAVADGFDFIGGNAQAEKTAKAPREKNDGRYLETMAKSFGTGVGVGAAGVSVLGVAALPVLAVGGGLVIGIKQTANQVAHESIFYAGTVTRGKVEKIFKRPSVWQFDSPFGMDPHSFPSAELLKSEFDVIKVDVDGPSNALVFAFVPESLGVVDGDIVDIKSPVGVFTQNTRVLNNLHYDFNRHMPRVVNVYCKHDNPSCQNDYDSSLGVISRHTDTEFPPSQYLIDPAIIAADQAKMRKDEAEKKAAQNSGGFSFM